MKETIRPELVHAYQHQTSGIDAGHGDDEPEKMADIIRACETLVFRVHATDGRRADTGRGRLVRLAHSIHADDSYLFKDVLNRLYSITRIYADDDRIERNLRDPEFYDSMSRASLFVFSQTF